MIQFLKENWRFIIILITVSGVKVSFNYRQFTLYLATVVTYVKKKTKYTYFYIMLSVNILCTYCKQNLELSYKKLTTRNNTHLLGDEDWFWLRVVDPRLLLAFVEFVCGTGFGMFCKF